MKTFSRLIILIMILGLTIKVSAQPPQIDITVAQFYYTITDPTWENGDHYIAHILLCNWTGTIIASTFYTEGQVNSPGTYQTASDYIFYGMYEYQMGYKVLMWVSKNDLPYGSQGNRTGISDVLYLDANDWLYPGTIRINSW